MIKWTAYLTNGEMISSQFYSFSEIPNIPITRIHLWTLNGKLIIFEGFEKYLIITTFYQIVQGGKDKIFDTINVLGKKDNKVCQISIHRKGKVFQCKNEWGKEWRPLIIEPLPMIDGKKQFNIKFTYPIFTKRSFWHSGLELTQAKVHLKGKNERF